ncbi:hypothetical protein TELCIR_06160 [Teladorsagia circumcincta]|uniref:Uncharacterized protein n=1 Tax=Teladorsagia circumcincta TaxID=45464 RepID=A0A2G9UNQ3_TELCI|nr:hypothetical protein TELCIR_06160 [Teladorsagia circumcincta]
MTCDLGANISPVFKDDFADMTARSDHQMREILHHLNALTPKERELERITLRRGEVVEKVARHSRMTTGRRLGEDDDQKKMTPTLLLGRLLYVSDISEPDVPSTKKRGKRKNSTPENTSQAKGKRLKLNLSKEKSKSTTTLNETPDLTGAAEEAYRRFEQTFSETSSSKSSPKSPQFLSLLPPPPPPPKPIQQQANLPKKGAALSADMVHLLVPPPPPPPPQPPVKDVPPPPPPRRLKASILEDLPPPPPPPKRLKPSRSSAVNKEATTKDGSCLVEPKQEPPGESSKVDDIVVMADVKTCLEHVVYLVSSIKPFDEISGELLPDKEVPVPFSQRLERVAASESNDGASSCADASAEKSSVEKSSSSSEEPQKDVPNEDEEEYDPLDATVVEDFEAYVPSAVVSRTQYTQMPYDDDYEEEECIQPMDSFHGEPVPDDDELFEVAAGIKPKRKEEVIVEERIPESTEKFEIDFYNGDLHLKGAPDNDWIIDPDNQDGLALVWGGVRSTHGILPKCRLLSKSLGVVLW